MSEMGWREFLNVLRPEERTSFVARARTIRAAKGQMVVSRSEASRDVFVVQEGQLETLIYSANGREISLRTLGPGQLFGELAAIDGQARSVSIIAVTEARLLAITSNDFRAIVTGSPAAAEWMMRRLTLQVRGLTNRVFELSALCVQARLHCELVRLYRQQGAMVTAMPTHAELANRIGTHREAVTREINALGRRKLIRTGRGRLEFLDPNGLEDELRTILRAPVEDEAGW